MKCDQVREWTSAALDGALMPGDSNSYSEHLQACPRCRLHHEEMRGALALLAELPQTDASDGFEERVWSRIAASREVRARRWALPSWARQYFGGELAQTWTGWSLAGVSAAVAALALVSADPAPFRLATHGNAPATAGVAGTGAAVAELTPTASSEKASLDSEEEFIAGMPEAIRVYLQQGQDLRLPDSTERYRRSNYSYPVRRITEPDRFQLTGEVSNPSPAAGSDQDATVISF